MALNNLLQLSLTKIGLICFFLYLLIVIINHVRSKKKIQYNKEDLKNSRALTQIYLDQFFITSKFYTFTATFIYIFGMTIIFILLRYLAIGDIVIISSQEHIPFIQIIFVYFIFFIVIILYRTLLMMLFKKEINKFYIYIKQFSWVDTIEEFLEFRPINQILGSLYLTTYRIATLTYKEDMYPIPMDELDYYSYLTMDDTSYVIENKKLILWIYKAKDLAQKYYIIQKFFTILAYIFRFLFKHNRHLYLVLPYFILISIFLIDLYNKEFNNIYLVSFIYIIIKTKRDFVNFSYNRKAGYDHLLSWYFYKNSFNYNQQRIYFYNDNNINIENYNTSRENFYLFRDLKYKHGVIEYIFNNFISPSLGPDPDYNKNKIKGIYRRFLVIIGCMMIGYHLLYRNDIQIDVIHISILLLPMIIMIYSHYKTYYTIEYIEEIDFEEYKYSLKYNIIFWIATLIQVYIFWILLLQPRLIFMESEILWDNWITITKIYSTEEKIIYLYQYFDYYLNLINNSNQNINENYLRYILRQIDFTTLIDNQVNLKDIQVYIKLLIDTYQYHESIQRMFIEELLIANKPNNSWYILLRNLLFIGVSVSTLINIKTIWLITKYISTPYGISLIVKDIYMKSLHNKLTSQEAIKIITKIFELIKFPFF